ncbi:MAG TPA: methyltransferase domain-containing protein [Allosphingosinicella sp.]|nr:methyltransferase domain-containing protein [Allosphingosinicella sp.]
MPSRPFARALAWGAGLMLVLVLAYLLLFRDSGAPAPAPRGFDPDSFVGARPKLDAPYVATDLEVVDAMLGLAEVRPGDFVVDLGSGDGRILIAAARSFGARGLGVDIDPARNAEANANARAAGVAGRVRFRREDLFETPLGQADVLTLYLTQEVNLRLRPRILAQMRPGTRVVSHDFDMGAWRWDQRHRIGTATVFLWIVPARVDGAWTLTAAGRSVPLVIAQSNQIFTGTAGTARIETGRIAGDRISFRADLGDGRRLFEGRVAGDTITPTDPDADWRAVRAP